jgi:hypothetical protein
MKKKKKPIKTDYARFPAHCLVCDKKVYTSAPYGTFNSWPMAYDSVVFHSIGNYGSTVYDADGGEYLQMVICDECLTKRAKRVRRVKTRMDPPPLHADKFETFDPKKPEFNDRGRKGRMGMSFIPYGPGS